MKKEIKRSMITIIIVYIGLIAALTIFQRNFLYFPSGIPDHTNTPWMNEITVQTKDGLKLSAWYQYPVPETKPTILYFHGNGGNIEHRIPKTLHFTEKKYGLLLAEYRGYGGNPAKPTEKGLYNDARAYMDWLINEQNTPPENIILYGESLGSGAAVQMATEYNIKALILDVPFSSTVDVAASKYFIIPKPLLNILIFDQYRSTDKIQSINAPLFIGLAGKDKIIPPRFGKKLFETANEPKTLKIYENADHNNLHLHSLSADTIKFIESLN